MKRSRLLSTQRSLARVVAVVIGAGTLLVATPGAASAHPLGNFTVNRFSGVVVSPDEVTVDHVLDIAEIPTAQRVPAIDTSSDGRLSPAELATWAKPTCVEAAQGLQLAVDGRLAPLAVSSASARSRAGQAGLPILRVECALALHRRPGVDRLPPLLHAAENRA